jgi:hypothetical protein
MNLRLRRELVQRLTRDARAIAGHFGVEYRSIEAERANVKSRYGICYEDGSIKIRLTHAVNGRPLKYSSLVSTLCHELAHLRHFDHGPRFKLLYHQMLEWSRANGIYRPRPLSGPRAMPDVAPAALMRPTTASPEFRAAPLRPRVRAPRDGSLPADLGDRRPARQLELFG